LEETAWIWISVVSIIVGVGVLAQLWGKSQGFKEEQALKSAVAKLEKNCRFLCNSADDTLVKASVVIPAATILYGSGEKLCFKREGSLSCASCNCNVTQGLLLNLTGSFAEKHFRLHEYKCSLLKNAERLEVECLG